MELDLVRRPGGSRGGNAQRRPAPVKRELTEAEVQKQVRETLKNFKGNLQKEKEQNIEEIKEMLTKNYLMPKLKHKF